MGGTFRPNHYLAGLIGATALGAVVLPWHVIEGGFWAFAWLASYPDADAGPALVLALAHQRYWLWPLVAVPALAIPALTRHGSGAGLLIAAATYGIV